MSLFSMSTGTTVGISNDNDLMDNQEDEEPDSKEESNLDDDYVEG